MLQVSFPPRPRMSSNIVAGASVHPDIFAGGFKMPRLLNIVAGANLARQQAKGVNNPKLSPADLVDIEHDLFLDPVYALKRHFRVYYLPGSVAANVMTFAPQRPCIPFMLHIPSGTAASTLTQLQNGVRQYFATSDPVPASMFSEKSPGVAHSLRPLLAKVGNTITAQTTVAAGTLPALGCFDMSEDGLLSEPIGAAMQIGFNAGSVAAASGTGTATISPQKTFRVRRVELDSTVTNWDATQDGTHGLQVTTFTVANDPQTEANGNLPGTLFDHAATAPMLDMDGDVCQVGAKIVIGFINKEATLAIVAQGVLWGDSVYNDDFEP